jgi:hypothetical protein
VIQTEPNLNVSLQDMIEIYIDLLGADFREKYIEQKRTDILAFKEKKPWSTYLPKLGQAIKDDDDRVLRCIGCGWELVQHRCVNCGLFYSAEGTLLGHVEVANLSDIEDAPHDEDWEDDDSSNDLGRLEPIHFGDLHASEAESETTNDSFVVGDDHISMDGGDSDSDMIRRQQRGSESEEQRESEEEAMEYIESIRSRSSGSASPIVQSRLRESSDSSDNEIFTPNYSSPRRPRRRIVQDLSESEHVSSGQSSDGCVVHKSPKKSRTVASSSSESSATDAKTARKRHRVVSSSDERLLSCSSDSNASSASHPSSKRLRLSDMCSEDSDSE